MCELDIDCFLARSCSSLVKALCGGTVSVLMAPINVISQQYILPDSACPPSVYSYDMKKKIISEHARTRSGIKNKAKKG